MSRHFGSITHPKEFHHERLIELPWSPELPVSTQPSLSDQLFHPAMIPLTSIFAACTLKALNWDTALNYMELMYPAIVAGTGSLAYKNQKTNDFELCIDDRRLYTKSIQKTPHGNATHHGIPLNIGTVVAIPTSEGGLEIIGEGPNGDKITIMVYADQISPTIAEGLSKALYTISLQFQEDLKAKNMTDLKKIGPKKDTYPTLTQ